jgi:hypothetical protein
MFRKIVLAGALALVSVGSAASQNYGTLNANVFGFNPTAAGTPLAVSTGVSAAALPAGVTVVATNVGAHKAPSAPWARRPRLRSNTSRQTAAGSPSPSARRRRSRA